MLAHLLLCEIPSYKQSPNMLRTQGQRAAQDHPLSFQLSSCDNLSTLHHSSIDAALQRGHYNQMPVVPLNKFLDCCSESIAGSPCVPDDKQDYTPNPALCALLLLLKSPRMSNAESWIISRTQACAAESKKCKFLYEAPAAHSPWHTFKFVLHSQITWTTKPMSYRSVYALFEWF